MLGVVTNGLLARMLSPSEFGAYFLALSIITVGAVIGSLGLTKTIVRFVAENMGMDQTGRARRGIYIVFAFTVLGALGVGLLYLFFGQFVSRYLFHSSLLVGVTALMAGWIVISVLQETTAETFRGFHNIRMATLLGGLATGGKSGGLVMRALMLACLALLWLANGEIDLKIVMLASIGSGTVSAILAVWLLRGKVSSLEMQDGDKPVRPSEVLRDGIPILFISLTSLILLSSADIWILGALGSQEEVAVYAAASRLVILVAMPLLVTNLVLPPIVAEMYARGETVKLERTVRTFSTLAGAPSLLLLVGFMFLGGPILGLVYGSYYQSGAVVLVLLSAARMVAVWSGSCGTVLQFTGHQTTMLRVNLLTSPLFILGALLVVGPYGPVGVASVSAATMILQNVVLVLVARKKTGVWTHVSFSLSPLRKALSNR
jgi:O-antigen/teichoic acid export membrane protein